MITGGEDTFPAVWSAGAPLQSPWRLDDPAEIARAQRTRAAMGLPGGQLSANPIPAEDEIPAEELAPIIAQAQSEADAQGVSGKGVTPFLLQRIFELTEGRSLTANISLVRNNARLGAKIAANLSKLPR